VEIVLAVPRVTAPSAGRRRRGPRRLARVRRLARRAIPVALMSRRAAPVALKRRAAPVALMSRGAAPVALKRRAAPVALKRRAAPVALKRCRGHAADLRGQTGGELERLGSLLRSELDRAAPLEEERRLRDDLLGVEPALARGGDELSSEHTRVRE